MSFCSRGQAELIRRVADHVRLHGRPIARGEDRRLTTTNSRIGLDYVCQSESTTRYVKRDPIKYAHILGYAEYPAKRDIVYSYGKVTRLRAEGWHTVISNNSVHIFGDLDKLTRDLTMILMADDLVAQ